MTQIIVHLSLCPLELILWTQNNLPVIWHRYIPLTVILFGRTSSPWSGLHVKYRLS